MILFPAVASAGDAPLKIDGTTTVDAQKVIELIQSVPDLVVIDSRKKKDFDAGHIENSVHLISTDTNADSLAKHVKSKSTPVLFYCNGLKCGRAADAAKIAVKSGYSKIYYYAKGLDEWNAQGLPLAK
jgi:rhodanese-related sulfurtransferase